MGINFLSRMGVEPSGKDIDIVSSFSQTPGAFMLTLKKGPVVLVEKNTGQVYMKDASGDIRGISANSVRSFDVLPSSGNPNVRFKVSLLWRSPVGEEIFETILGGTNNAIQAKNWCDLANSIFFKQGVKK